MSSLLQQLLATQLKQGVALMGRNHTGPPYSVGHPTARMPGGRPPAVLDSDTVTSFKSRLKTHLFSQAFSHTPTDH